MVRGTSSCRETTARFCGVGCEVGMRGAGWAPFSQMVRPVPVQRPLRGGSALPSSREEGTRPRLLITTNWVNAEMIPLLPSPPRGIWELQRSERLPEAAWLKRGYQGDAWGSLQGGAQGAEGSPDQAWAHMASSPAPSLLAWGAARVGCRVTGLPKAPWRLQSGFLGLAWRAGRQGRASWHQEHWESVRAEPPVCPSVPSGRGWELCPAWEGLEAQGF